MRISGVVPRRYSPRTLLVVGTVALLLLVASLLVEVRIILESPEYGDVTGLVQPVWQAVLGLTTIGSFLIGVYTLVTDAEGEPSGPAASVEIKGTGHEIHVHPGHEGGRRGDVPDEVDRFDDENGSKSGELDGETPDTEKQTADSTDR